MPRKQNGWGASKSLAFKPMNPVSKAKGFGAAGAIQVTVGMARL